MRRLLGRSFAKALTFLSAPIVMIWNAIITWKVMADVRLVVMGSALILRLVDQLVPMGDAESFGPVMREQIFRALAAVIVKNAEIHPNVELLLRFLRSRVGDVFVEQIDNFELFLQELAKCADEEKVRILEFLCLACLADGALQRRDRRFLERVAAASGWHFLDVQRLELLADDFMAGRMAELSVETLRRVVTCTKADCLRRPLAVRVLYRTKKLVLRLVTV
eukprot:TRINITY_DN8626_c0_g1_i3.p3 TRINITY_DN8626_c0_g1~~TRINITY_DN8626_c0_g1_i3.p3  ORF type:complete len:222 (+),score=52.03 TRINITY_DN8626_c0_g1_i3:687-1352(+)